MIRRREFLGSLGTLSLAGCGSRRRSWSGSMVGASHGLGHRLRDGSGFPEPSVQEDVDVAVIGSGIAGLVAAWRLRQAGRSVTIFELEPEAGGNSAGGRNEIAGYPWGAHYIPVPGDATTDTRELLEDLGALRGGRPDERFLCHDPVERLYFRGEWQEGLVPQLGLDAAERESIARFLALMDEWRSARGNDGRRAFAIPVDESSADPRWREIDRLSMAEWLDREHFRGGELRWYIDYCCRDDYGAGISAVSAWAGVHYFASRDSSSVLTWPEGNAWVVHRLCERLPGAIRGSQLVYRATAGGSFWFSTRGRDARGGFRRGRLCARRRGSWPNGWLPI